MQESGWGELTGVTGKRKPEIRVVLLRSREVCGGQLRWVQDLVTESPQVAPVLEGEVKYDIQNLPCRIGPGSAGARWARWARWAPQLNQEVRVLRHLVPELPVFRVAGVLLRSPPPPPPLAQTLRQKGAVDGEANRQGL